MPSHLTVIAEPSQPTAQASGTASPAPDSAEHSATKAKGKSAGRGAMSSLQRAVLERLEVQKAMNDLSSVKTEPDS